MYRIRMDSSCELVELELTGALPPSQLAGLQRALRRFAHGMFGRPVAIHVRVDHAFLDDAELAAEICKVRRLAAQLGLDPARVSVSAGPDLAARRGA